MPLIVVELYDALRAAGVADDRSTAAARGTLYGHAPGFIGPPYDALSSAGVSEEDARAAATADYRADGPND